MADQTLPAFSALYNKLNALALLFDTKGIMDETSLSLDWSERRGIAAMLRDLTDDLEGLGGHLNAPDAFPEARH
jgi:hypothetical protein